MFDVLAFVYEHYQGGDSCPEPTLLQRKLSAVGFESDEIHEALIWLRPLLEGAPTPGWLADPQPGSMRVYTPQEQRKLGHQCLGFLDFLGRSAVLDARMRETIIERALAAPGAQVGLADFKWVVLLVFWRYGQVPDALILDELQDQSGERLAH
ncbi:MAG: DUF494 family protein [Rhodoferax sp.]